MYQSRPFKTFIAAFTTVAFFVTSVIWMPNGFAAASTPEVGLPYQAQLDRNLHVAIPQELGKLEHLNVGQGPAIFHIQTAHGHYQAQQQIRSLLHYLDKNYGVKTLLVEGSAFELDPELIRFFPNDKAKTLKAADALTHHALLKGPELYLLDNTSHSARALGIEELQSYRSNGVAFAEVLRAKQKTEQFLSDMNMQIERLSSHYLNKDLRDFLRRIESFEKNQIPLDTWLASLKDESQKRLAIDLASPAQQVEWPTLVRIFKIQELNAKLDRQKFPKERDEFLKAIRRFLPSKTTDHRLQTTAKTGLLSTMDHGLSTYAQVEALLKSEMQSVQLPDPETSLLFEDMAKQLPANFNYDLFPNVRYYIGTLLLRSELKADRLMREVQKLSDKIAAKLVRNKTEARLVALLADHRLLGKLFALELLPQDYDALLARKGEAKPSFMINELTGKAYTSRRTKTVEFTHIAELDQLFTSAMKFYFGVKERDGKMEARIEERLKETGATKVVVITGGFHSGPFQKYFSDKNYTYALIAPKLSGADEAGYKAYIENTLHLGSQTIDHGPQSKLKNETVDHGPWTVDRKSTRETVFAADRQVLAPENPYGIDQTAVRAEVRSVIAEAVGRSESRLAADRAKSDEAATARAGSSKTEKIVKDLAIDRFIPQLVQEWVDATAAFISDRQQAHFKVDHKGNSAKNFEQELSAKRNAVAARVVRVAGIANLSRITSMQWPGEFYKQMAEGIIKPLLQKLNLTIGNSDEPKELGSAIFQEMHRSEARLLLGRVDEFLKTALDGRRELYERDFALRKLSDIIDQLKKYTPDHLITTVDTIAAEQATNTSVKESLVSRYLTAFELEFDQLGLIAEIYQHFEKGFRASKKKKWFPSVAGTIKDHFFDFGKNLDSLIAAYNLLLKKEAWVSLYIPSVHTGPIDELRRRDEVLSEKIQASIKEAENMRRNISTFITEIPAAVGRSEVRNTQAAGVDRTTEPKTNSAAILKAVQEIVALFPGEGDLPLYPSNVAAQIGDGVEVSITEIETAVDQFNKTNTRGILTPFQGEATNYRFVSKVSGARSEIREKKASDQEIAGEIRIPERGEGLFSFSMAVLYGSFVVITALLDYFLITQWSAIHNPLAKVCGAIVGGVFTFVSVMPLISKVANLNRSRTRSETRKGKDPVESFFNRSEARMVLSPDNASDAIGELVQTPENERVVMLVNPSRPEQFEEASRIALNLLQSGKQNVFVFNGLNFWAPQVQMPTSTPVRLPSASKAVLGRIFDVLEKAGFRPEQKHYFDGRSISDEVVGPELAKTYLEAIEPVLREVAGSNPHQEGVRDFESGKFTVLKGPSGDFRKIKVAVSGREYSLYRNAHLADTWVRLPDGSHVLVNWFDPASFEGYASVVPEGAEYLSLGPKTTELFGSILDGVDNVHQTSKVHILNVGDPNDTFFESLLAGSEVLQADSNDPALMTVLKDREIFRRSETRKGKDPVESFFNRSESRSEEAIVKIVALHEQVFSKAIWELAALADYLRGRIPLVAAVEVGFVKWDTPEADRYQIALQFVATEMALDHGITDSRQLKQIELSLHQKVTAGEDEAALEALAGSGVGRKEAEAILNNGFKLLTETPQLAPEESAQIQMMILTQVRRPNHYSKITFPEIRVESSGSKTSDDHRSEARIPEQFQKYAGYVDTFLENGIVPVDSLDVMGTVYSPGVGDVALAIEKDPSLEEALYGEVPKTVSATGREVVIFSDGSAVLGIGLRGPGPMRAVSEGKRMLLKWFGGVNMDIGSVDTKTLWQQFKKEKDIGKKKQIAQAIEDRLFEAITAYVKNVRATEGLDTVVMLEDIAQPICFSLEKRLNEAGIPTVHDDQHGTAIVFAGALLRAARETGRDIRQMKIVLTGAGAAGTATAKLLRRLGFGTDTTHGGNIIVCDSKGSLSRDRRDLDPVLDRHKLELAALNTRNFSGTLSEALRDADAFIGLSEPVFLWGQESIFKIMKDKAIIFLGANPAPEADPAVVKRMSNVRFVATGAFRYPQGSVLNNSYSFPAIFRAFRDAPGLQGFKIDEIEAAAATAISNLDLSKDEQDRGKLLPSTFENGRFNPSVFASVLREVIKVLDPARDADAYVKQVLLDIEQQHQAAYAAETSNKNEPELQSARSEMRIDAAEAKRVSEELKEMVKDPLSDHLKDSERTQVQRILRQHAKQKESTLTELQYRIAQDILGQFNSWKQFKTLLDKVSAEGIKDYVQAANFVAGFRAAYRFDGASWKPDFDRLIEALDLAGAVYLSEAFVNYLNLDPWNREWQMFVVGVLAELLKRKPSLSAHWLVDWLLNTNHNPVWTLASTLEEAVKLLAPLQENHELVQNFFRDLKEGLARQESPLYPEMHQSWRTRIINLVSRSEARYPAVDGEKLKGVWSQFAYSLSPSGKAIRVFPSRIPSVSTERLPGQSARGREYSFGLRLHASRGTYNGLSGLQWPQRELGVVVPDATQLFLPSAETFHIALAGIYPDKNVTTLSDELIQAALANVRSQIAESLLPPLTITIKGMRRTDNGTIVADLEESASLAQLREIIGAALAKAGWDQNVTKVSRGPGGIITVGRIIPAPEGNKMAMSEDTLGNLDEAIAKADKEISANPIKLTLSVVSFARPTREFLAEGWHTEVQIPLRARSEMRKASSDEGSVTKGEKEAPWPMLDILRDAKPFQRTRKETRRRSIIRAIKQWALMSETSQAGLVGQAVSVMNQRTARRARSEMRTGTSLASQRADFKLAKAYLSLLELMEKNRKLPGNVLSEREHALSRMLWAGGVVTEEFRKWLVPVDIPSIQASDFDGILSDTEGDLWVLTNAEGEQGERLFITRHTGTKLVLEEDGHGLLGGVLGWLVFGSAAGLIAGAVAGSQVTEEEVVDREQYSYTGIGSLDAVHLQKLLEQGKFTSFLSRAQLSSKRDTLGATLRKEAEKLTPALAAERMDDGKYGQVLDDLETLFDLGRQKELKAYADVVRDHPQADQVLDVLRQKWMSLLLLDPETHHRLIGIRDMISTPTLAVIEKRKAQRRVDFLNDLWRAASSPTQGQERVLASYSTGNDGGASAQAAEIFTDLNAIAVRVDNLRAFRRTFEASPESDLFDSYTLQLRIVLPWSAWFSSRKASQQKIAEVKRSLREVLTEESQKIAQLYPDLKPSLEALGSAPEQSRSEMREEQFTRTAGQSMVINNNLVVTMVNVGDTTARFGIDAPGYIIFRKELSPDKIDRLRMKKARGGILALTRRALENEDTLIIEERGQKQVAEIQLLQVNEGRALLAIRTSPDISVLPSELTNVSTDNRSRRSEARQTIRVNYDRDDVLVTIGADRIKAKTPVELAGALNRLFLKTNMLAEGKGDDTLVISVGSEPRRQFIVSIHSQHRLQKALENAYDILYPNARQTGSPVLSWALIGGVIAVAAFLGVKYFGNPVFRPETKSAVPATQTQPVSGTTARSEVRGKSNWIKSAVRAIFPAYTEEDHDLAGNKLVIGLLFVSLFGIIAIPPVLISFHKRSQVIQTPPTSQPVSTTTPRSESRDLRQQQIQKMVGELRERAQRAGLGEQEFILLCRYHRAVLKDSSVTDREIGMSLRDKDGIHQFLAEHFLPQEKRPLVDAIKKYNKANPMSQESRALGYHLSIWKLMKALSDGEFRQWIARTTEEAKPQPSASNDPLAALQASLGVAQPSSTTSPAPNAKVTSPAPGSALADLAKALQGGKRSPSRSEARTAEITPEGIDPEIHRGKTVFVTGGKGYIAGAVIRALLDAGSKVIAFDNEEKNKSDLPDDPNVRFVKGDIRDPQTLRDAMKGADAVVHLAAYIEAGVSVHKPGLFFENNVVGTTNVLDAMVANGIHNLAFASSAGVYSGKGLLRNDSLTEEIYPDPQNPYGETKLMMEKLMADYGRKGIRFGALRFFNVAGAIEWNGKWHGEDHRPETHLLPLLMFAALGVIPSIKLFGNDYKETPDGTPIRDYIHIEDLANAHLRILAHLYAGRPNQIVNLGTGEGTSVKEAVAVVENESQRKVPAIQEGRREGDPAILRAGHDLATRVLGWKPVHNFISIVRSAWLYHFKVQANAKKVVDFSKPDRSTEPASLLKVLNGIRSNPNVSDSVKFEILFRLFVASQDRSGEFYKRARALLSLPGDVRELVSRDASLRTQWGLLDKNLFNRNQFVVTDPEEYALFQMSDYLYYDLLSSRSEVRPAVELISRYLDHGQVGAAIRAYTLHYLDLDQNDHEALSQALLHEYIASEKAIGRVPRLRLVGKLGGTETAWALATPYGLISPMITSPTHVKDGRPALGIKRGDLPEVGNTLPDIATRIARPMLQLLQKYRIDLSQVDLDAYLSAPGFFDPEMTLTQDEPNIKNVPKRYRFGASPEELSVAPLGRRFLVENSIPNRLRALAHEEAGMDLNVKLTVVHDGTGHALGELGNFGALQGEPFILLQNIGTGYGNRAMLDGKPVTGNADVGFVRNEIPHFILRNPSTGEWVNLIDDFGGDKAAIRAETFSGDPNPYREWVSLEDYVKGGAVQARFNEMYLKALHDPEDDLHLSALQIQKDFDPEGKGIADRKSLKAIADAGNRVMAAAYQERAYAAGLGSALIIADVLWEVAFMLNFEERTGRPLSLKDLKMVWDGFYLKFKKLGTEEKIKQGIADGLKEWGIDAGEAESFVKNNIVASTIPDDLREFLGGLPAARSESRAVNFVKEGNTVSFTIPKAKNEEFVPSVAVLEALIAEGFRPDFFESFTITLERQSPIGVRISEKTWTRLWDGGEIYGWLKGYAGSIKFSGTLRQEPKNTRELEPREAITAGMIAQSDADWTRSNKGFFDLYVAGKSLGAIAGIGAIALAFQAQWALAATAAILGAFFFFYVAPFHEKALQRASRDAARETLARQERERNEERARLGKIRFTKGADGNFVVKRTEPGTKRSESRISEEALHSHLEKVAAGWGIDEASAQGNPIKQTKNRADRIYVERMTRQHIAAKPEVMDTVGPKAPLRMRKEKGSLDEVSKGGNAVITALLSDEELRERGVFKRGSLEHDPGKVVRYLEAASRTSLIWNTLDGGIGESLMREAWLLNKGLRARLRDILSDPAKAGSKYQSSLAKLKGAEENGETADVIAALREMEKLAGLEPLQVKMGAKGTDLGRIEKIHGNSYFVGDAEARLLVMVDLALSKKYGKMAFQPLVNYQSKVSYEKLMGQPYLWDVLEGRSKPRTYGEALREAGIDTMEPLEQRDLPKFEIDPGETKGLPTTDGSNPKKGQPGGHGQWGVYFFIDFTDNAPSQDGFFHVRFFGNGDNRKGNPEPIVAGFMVVEKIPILKITTAATAIDKKGGKEVVRVVKINGQVINVLDQFEEVDAQAAGQSDMFYAAGQRNGFGQEGKQLFNTNLFFFNIDLLHAILKEMREIVGPDDFLDAVTPVLFDKSAKAITIDGKKFVSMDSAIGYVVHGINTFYSTEPRLESLRAKYGKQLLYYMDYDRDIFAPKKKAEDQYLQEGTDYYGAFDETIKNFRDSEPGLLPPGFDFTDPFVKDGKVGDTKFWTEAQHWLDSLGLSRVKKLKSLKVEGRVTLRNVEYIGDVVILNRLGQQDKSQPAKRAILSRGEYLDQLKALGYWAGDHLRLENVQIVIHEDGLLSVEAIEAVRSESGATKLQTTEDALEFFKQASERGAVVSVGTNFQISERGVLVVNPEDFQPGVVVMIGDNVRIDGDVRLRLGGNNKVVIEDDAVLDGPKGMKYDLRLASGEWLYISARETQMILETLAQGDHDAAFRKYVGYVDAGHLNKAFYIRKLVDSLSHSPLPDKRLFTAARMLGGKIAEYEAMRPHRRSEMRNVDERNALYASLAALGSLLSVGMERGTDELVWKNRLSYTYQTALEIVGPVQASVMFAAAAFVRRNAALLPRSEARLDKDFYVAVLSRAKEIAEVRKQSLPADLEDEIGYWEQAIALFSEKITVLQNGAEIPGDADKWWALSTTRQASPRKEDHAEVSQRMHLVYGEALRSRSESRRLETMTPAYQGPSVVKGSQIVDQVMKFLPVTLPDIFDSGTSKVLYLGLSLNGRVPFYEKMNIPSVVMVHGSNNRVHIERYLKEFRVRLDDAVSYRISFVREPGSIDVRLYLTTINAPNREAEAMRVISEIEKSSWKNADLMWFDFTKGTVSYRMQTNVPGSVALQNTSPAVRFVASSRMPVSITVQNVASFLTSETAKRELAFILENPGVIAETIDVDRIEREVSRERVIAWQELTAAYAGEQGSQERREISIIVRTRKAAHESFRTTEFVPARLFALDFSSDVSNAGARSETRNSTAGANQEPVAAIKATKITRRDVLNALEFLTGFPAVVINAYLEKSGASIVRNGEFVEVTFPKGIQRPANLVPVLGKARSESRNLLKEVALWVVSIAIPWGAFAVLGYYAVTAGIWNEFSAAERVLEVVVAFAAKLTLAYAIHGTLASIFAEKGLMLRSSSPVMLFSSGQRQRSEIRQPAEFRLRLIPAAKPAAGAQLDKDVRTALAQFGASDTFSASDVTRYLSRSYAPQKVRGALKLLTADGFLVSTGSQGSGNSKIEFYGFSLRTQAFLKSQGPVLVGASTANAPAVTRSESRNAEIISKALEGLKTRMTEAASDRAKLYAFLNEPQDLFEAVSLARVASSDMKLPKEKIDGVNAEVLGAFRELFASDAVLAERYQKELGALITVSIETLRTFSSTTAPVPAVSRSESRQVRTAVSQHPISHEDIEALTPEMIWYIKKFYFEILPLRIYQSLETSKGLAGVAAVLKNTFGIPVSYAATGEVAETAALSGLFRGDEDLVLADPASVRASLTHARSQDVQNASGTLVIGQDLLLAYIYHSPRALYYLLKQFVDSKTPGLVTVGDKGLIWSAVKRAIAKKGVVPASEFEMLEKVTAALDQGTLLKVVEQKNGETETTVLNRLAEETQGGIATIHLKQEMLFGLTDGAHFAFRENVGTGDLMVATGLALAGKFLADLIRNVPDPKLRAELLTKFVNEHLQGVQKNGVHGFVVERIADLAQHFVAQAIIAKAA